MLQAHLSWRYFYQSVTLPLQIGNAHHVVLRERGSSSWKKTPTYLSERLNSQAWTDRRGDSHDRQLVKRSGERTSDYTGWAKINRADAVFFCLFQLNAVSKLDSFWHMETHKQQFTRQDALKIKIGLSHYCLHKRILKIRLSEQRVLRKTYIQTDHFSISNVVFYNISGIATSLNVLQTLT